MADVKNVDCIFIFMLDEERDLFLKFNKQFIISVERKDEFMEFVFFDKHGKLRTGVICSNGTAMGNTEACSLFYKLSRHYIAELYINLGVSGIIRDVNIGDVIMVTRLSTLGEQNATDSPWQLMDISGSFGNDSNKAAQNAINKLSNIFVESTREHVNDFRAKLKEVGKENICTFDENIIKTGWCGTVPSVIKGEEGQKDFPILRKLNMVDMEAYYLVLWHDLVKHIEPKHSKKNSKFLVFKSGSDYGDENKKVVEQCGSRNLAMRNLCTVVSNYCTTVHEFRRVTNENIFSYFENEIKNNSEDMFALKSREKLEEAIRKFEKICSFFIESKDEDFDKNNSIEWAFKQLSCHNKSLILCGRSGTAKSTFISYLYYKALGSTMKPVLLDVSKYSSDTIPSDEQIVYLLEKLMSSEKNLCIFLDGIDKHATYYDRLLTTLECASYKNISLCIGDIIGEDDPINIVPQTMNALKVEFCGMSVHLNCFDEMLNAAEDYFNFLGYKIKSTTTKDFVLKSQISNIDFRLLSMISCRKEDTIRNKNLYTFLNSCIFEKFGRSNFIEYKKLPGLFGTDDSINIPAKYMKLHHNSYANSLAVAQQIIDIFEKGDDESINIFIKSKFILSDDMNLFLNHQLKSNKQSIKIIDNIISTLKDSTKQVSICVDTQLLYSISCAIKPDNPSYDTLKELIEQKVIEAKECYTISTNADKHLWAIRYRTLCIVLDKYFNIAKYLNEYNEMILHDKLTSMYNLYFHFLYYSKSPFRFDNIKTFNVDFLSNEAFLNTYYVLRSFFYSDQFFGKMINKDPFAFMNIITYLCLIKEVVIIRKRFDYLKEEIIALLNKLKETFENIESHEVRLPEYCKTIYNLLLNVSKEINKNF